MNCLSVQLPMIQPDIKLNCPVYHLETTTSTNQLLKDWMPLCDTAVYADFQTAGRGQGDHLWTCAQKQGLLMSLLYYPQNDITAELLLKISAITVCRCVNRYLQNHPDSAVIKKPNDILINGHKLGGILLENFFHGHKLTASIIGIGINLHQQEFSAHNFSRSPISFKQLGIPICTEDLLFAVLKEFYEIISWDAQKIEEIYSAKAF